jgi:hypothetical protein
VANNRKGSPYQEHRDNMDERNGVNHIGDLLIAWQLGGGAQSSSMASSQRRFTELAELGTNINTAHELTRVPADPTQMLHVGDALHAMPFSEAKALLTRYGKSATLSMVGKACGVGKDAAHRLLIIAHQSFWQRYNDAVARTHRFVTHYQSRQTPRQ